MALTEFCKDLHLIPKLRLSVEFRKLTAEDAKVRRGAPLAMRLASAVLCDLCGDSSTSYGSHQLGIAGEIETLATWGRPGSIRLALL